MTFSRASEGQKIGQQIGLLGRRQAGAVGVSAIAVTDEPGIEAEPFRRVLTWIAGRSDEAPITPVHHVEAAHECGRPLWRRLQKVAQTRNGAVVEIWPV